MPNHYRTPDSTNEPYRRFYPTQEANRSYPEKKMPGQYSLSRHNTDDAAYLIGRHPILLQRLYHAVDSAFAPYTERSFLYDTYPDYVSLHLMRDRILKETPSLTADFLQAGCPIDWLNLLTDTVITDLLCKKRCQRNPIGVANTTSLQSVSRS